MSLRITLRDGEKMIVNGAVLRASGRTEIVVENQAAILRGREIMGSAEATTPARRLYFATTVAYIDGEDGRAEHQDRIVTLLRELMAALEADAAKAACVRFAGRVATSDFYRALADCRELIAYEAEAFARLQTQAA